MATSSKPRKIKCPHCGKVFIIPSLEDTSIHEGEGNNPIPPQVGDKVKEVFGKLDKLRGYRPPKRKAEAASVIRMLKTYTPDQIMEAWALLKQDKFWQNKELFMMTIESQIGAILKNGTYPPRYRGTPIKYTRPEELLQ